MDCSGLRYWLLLVTTFLCFHHIQSQDNYKHDGADSFCMRVPSETQIDQYESACSGCRGLTDPIRAMRKCCDKQKGYRVGCLDQIRENEIRVNSLFLNWRDDEKYISDEMYRKHMTQCRNSYMSDTVNKQLNIARFFDDTCGADSSASLCKEGFTLTVADRAMASICVNNKAPNAVKPYAKMSQFYTVHFKCFTTQALTEKYQSIIDYEAKFSDYCVNENYGFDLDMKTWEEKELYYKMGMGFVWEKMKNAEGWKGAYDMVDRYNDYYLETVCNFDNDDDFSKICLNTPVTQTVLTYQSYDTLMKKEHECCRNRNDVKSIKQCLTDNNMFQQFYGLSGSYMRALVREQTGIVYECVSNKMLIEAGLSDRKAELTYKDSKKRYGKFPEVQTFGQALPQAITPANYHFFLKDFVHSVDQNDEYYGAACEACTLGERLAVGAYVKPGLMCPALVSDALYAPFKNSPCPDKQFYKFQVAHYCCLSAAVKMFNIGPSFNPNQCPDGIY